MRSHGERSQERRSGVVSPGPRQSSVAAPGRPGPDDRRGPAASDDRRQRATCRTCRCTWPTWAPRTMTRSSRSGLIENEQGTLELVNEALDRMERGRSGSARNAASRSRSRGSRRSPTRGTAFAVQGSWRVANEATSGRRSEPVDPLLGIALGGTAFDLVTKAIVFARIGPPPSPVVPLDPAGPRAPHQPKHRGPLGTRRRPARQQPHLRRALGRRGGHHLLLALLPGAASSRVLTIALGLIMAGALGNCYDRLVFGHVRDFVHFHVDPDRLRLRDLQFRRQHAGHRRVDAGPLRLRPENACRR